MSTPSGPTASPRILVVEDDLVNQKVLSRMLELRGYTVDVADHGGIALEKLRTEPFDLVLLDMQMPVLDGFETLRRLREDPSFSQLPVVACTALAMSGDRERCLHAGCDDYLSKPILRSPLDSILARWAPIS